MESMTGCLMRGLRIGRIISYHIILRHSEMDAFFCFKMFRIFDK